MNQLIYVPIIVHGRDKYEYNAISCGCFSNNKSAINSLIDKLVETNFLAFDIFENILEENKLNQIIVGVDENNITDEQLFVKQYLKEKVNGDIDMLKNVCNKYGDTYYNDGWNFQIDQHHITK